MDYLKLYKETFKELIKMSSLYYKEKSKYESLRDSVRIVANSDLTSKFTKGQIMEAIQYSEEY